MFDGRLARILIVDDNALNRRKLELAIGRLGHDTQVVENGVEALASLRNQQFDTVVLDLLMPEMDGFEVMQNMAEDSGLREIPVIVISDLEGEPESVSRAITLGAEDFLPKGFDPVILNARLTASLRKKIFRDQELAYFARVRKLTEAAGQIQSGVFDETEIDALKAEARHEDPIGQLAQVFRGMAKEIHAREVRLLERIRLLQGSILLLVCAATTALTPSLSRIAANQGATPLGMIVWVDILAFLICVTIMVARRNFPTLSRSDWMFFASWAFLVGILQHGTVFFFAAKVEATYITMLVALETLMVFAFAALLRQESTSSRRIAGLFVGLGGIGLALFDRLDGGGTFWLVAALVIPLLYAVETIFVAAKRPQHIDLVASLGIMFGVSVLFAVPLALAFGQFMPAGALLSPLGVATLTLAACTLIANFSFVRLIDLAGAIFASQVNYVTAMFGIFWGMLLLGERLSIAAWGAMAIVILGVVLVGAKASDKPVTIQRDYKS